MGMEFEVKTDLFKKVVSCASRAASSKAIQPILNNLLICGDKGFLFISATDLDLAIECKLPAEVHQSGKITVPARKLDEIVNKAPGENINFSIDKNQLAKILSNKAKFQINGTSSDEFPEVIKKEEGVEKITINRDELLRGISLTSFSASKMESTSILSGLSFKVSKNKFEIAGTDGSRLSRYIGSIEDGKSTNINLVIPWRAMEELERLMNSFDGDKNISISFLQGQVIFQSEDFSLSTRTMSGTFPEYEKLIPSEQPNKAIFLRSELLSSLERVSILANERTNVVKLSFEKGKKVANINSNSPDYGNANDEVGVDYFGSSLEVAFNYKYLSECLRNIGSDKVVVEMGSSLSPIILKINEEKNFDYTYLIMPVQMR